MRVIIAGGRDFGNRPGNDDVGQFKGIDGAWLVSCMVQMGNALDRLYRDFEDEYHSPIKELHVITGGAPGADQMGSDWAVVNWVPLHEHLADWGKYGKKAGVIRNQVMADNADVLVAFWDGKSPGTKDMITRALKNGLEVHVYRYQPTTISN